MICGATAASDSDTGSTVNDCGPASVATRPVVVHVATIGAGASVKLGRIENEPASAVAAAETGAGTTDCAAAAETLGALAVAVNVTGDAVTDTLDVQTGPTAVRMDAAGGGCICWSNARFDEIAGETAVSGVKTGVGTNTPSAVIIAATACQAAAAGGIASVTADVTTGAGAAADIATGGGSMDCVGPALMTCDPA